jgi:hypothetical protein
MPPTAGTAGAPASVDAAAAAAAATAALAARFGLPGRRALVTGGSRGIGRAVAEQLAAAGASVYICALREPELGATIQELRSRGLDVQARMVKGAAGRASGQAGMWLRPNISHVYVWEGISTIGSWEGLRYRATESSVVSQRCRALDEMPQPASCAPALCCAPHYAATGVSCGPGG